MLKESRLRNATKTYFLYFSLFSALPFCWWGKIWELVRTFLFVTRLKIGHFKNIFMSNYILWYLLCILRSYIRTFKLVSRRRRNVTVRSNFLLTISALFAANLICRSAFVTPLFDNVNSLTVDCTAICTHKHWYTVNSTATRMLNRRLLTWSSLYLL
jgi:hypothetical protein